MLCALCEVMSRHACAPPAPHTPTHTPPPHPPLQNSMRKVSEFMSVILASDAVLASPPFVSRMYGELAAVIRGFLTRREPFPAYVLTTMVSQLFEQVNGGLLDVKAEVGKWACRRDVVCSRSCVEWRSPHLCCRAWGQGGARIQGPGARGQDCVLLTPVVLGSSDVRRVSPGRGWMVGACTLSGAFCRAGFTFSVPPVWPPNDEQLLST
jgi:hypothetical protein